MNKFQSSQSLSDQLNQPFSYDEYGVNYEGQVYISAQSVVERLNEVLGVLNWELEPLTIDINQDLKSVSILAELRIFDVDRERWVTRRQYGNDTMTIKRDETEPTGQAFEDAKKSALTDALKKCASWIGVASDVYSSRLSAITRKKNEPAYTTVLNHFGLNRQDYDNGVVVLPDSYKGYYEENGWFGIFQSDITELFYNGTGNSTSGFGDSNPSSGNQGNSSFSSSNQSGGNSGKNSPTPFRVMVKSKPVIQQDGTAKFEAMLENSTSVNVIVPREKASFSLTFNPGTVIKLKGWLNETTGFLRVGKANIEVESKAADPQTA